MHNNNLFVNAFVICSILLFSVPQSFNQNVGPLVKMTNGEVWPKPVLQRSYDEYLTFEPENFHFNITGYSCDDLQDAFKRYNSMLFLKATKTFKQHISLSTKFIIDEIEISNAGGHLFASSIWGILRGLETFSQLVYLETDGSTFVIRCTSIVDYPKFRHRGFLLDTSRHYYPIESITKTLDAMSYSKMNVFHWHMVDDNSFPYQSSAFPNLSERGAFGKSAIYTKNDVKYVIEYARLRGIRVIPEIDTPGHSLSWRLGGIPGLLAQCSDSDPNHFGPIDPTIEENYNFINTLLAEVNELFLDNYLHLGGDEVNTTCWTTNKRIQTFMHRNNIKNVTELKNYYFTHIFNMTRNLKALPIVWEEIFDEKINLDSNVVVHVWKGGYNYSIVSEIMKSGHPVLFSSCWYMNYIKYGTDWPNFYRCDPTAVAGNNRLFLGGEACMWGEFADEANLLPTSWPRTCAVAEVLWSHRLNETEAKYRIEEHVCRMRRRGIPAQPANGPSYCHY
ncbi:beta-hexosaminidase subunit beta-like isoform X2 [Myzus persicae]|uniref:beta-hexosaminidase subunit beta-like isoform X2 n=1 Tax=Myzus persicae TaxID=13164 RepID=UPI000B931C69|nr:beta-hexosaminidase subunit beta-like isoform X2 [Myzus persicae]